MKANLIAAALLCLLPLAAQATVYDCKVNSGTMNGGYLTDRYVFEYLPEANSIQIYDGLIAHFNNDQPMQGSVTSASDAKLMFSWAVHMRNSAGQKTKMQFRGVLYFANSEFSVQANPVGYVNKYHARGTCALAK